MKTKRGSGLLVIVVGPSGVGKTAVVRALEGIYGKITGRVITTTTRQPRPGERDGVDYHFITKKEFKKRDKEGKFYETNAYANMPHLYGTGCADMDSALKKNKIVFIVLDVNGTQAIKEKIPEALVVFLVPGDEKDLKQRIESRLGADKEVTRKRLATALEELKMSRNFSRPVVNEDGKFDATIEEIRQRIDLRLNLSR